MTITTYEGIVKKGQIQFSPEIQLPENAKVYVIVPEVEINLKKVVQVLSPQLVYREQAAQFRMQVSEESPNAEI